MTPAFDGTLTIGGKTTKYSLVANAEWSKPIDLFGETTYKQSHISCDADGLVRKFQD